MPFTVATHSGPFHADDVLAVALLRCFFEPSLSVVRTRDPAVLQTVDSWVDVGGEYDPARKRFDHHQNSYQGPLSSAGMVLCWLQDQGKLPKALAQTLRHRVVDYVDAVDNGRQKPDPQVPCFASMIDAFGEGIESLPAFDAAFEQAVLVAKAYLDGLQRAWHGTTRARSTVVAAMNSAKQQGNNVLVFNQYLAWKAPYFDHGGSEHPTEYVLFPGTEGDWRVVAIPPSEHSFDQKRPLPLAWAGLSGQALEAVTQVPGSVFCHKNRFIAVFRTQEAAITALEQHGLMRRANEQGG